MLYYGERKKGCRFMEVYLHGYRTLIIENDLIRVMLLVDKGTDIISYVHKASDTDFVWTNPMGLSSLAKRRMAIMDDYCYSDNYLGGMFEILPNFGNECTYGEMHFTQHSEVSLLPWEYQVLEDSAEKIVFKFTVKLSKMPLMLTKTLTITNSSTALLFDEELTNIGAVELPYLWAQHPCIGAPFLSGDCVFELPFTDNIKMPTAGEKRDFFSLFESGENNFGAVRDTKTGLGIGFSFDEKTFTHCGLWISDGEDRGHHKWNGGYVASILPFNCGCMTLSAAAKMGTAPVIAPGEKKKTWHTITVFSKNTPVKKIHKNGEVE